MKFDRVEFAARRRVAQDDMIAALEPVVGRALDRKQAGSDTWWRPVVDAARPLFDSVVRDDGGDPGKAAGTWALTSLDLAHALTKTGRIDEYSHTLIATMVASAVLSAATYAAAAQDSEPFELEWVSMHDGKVRHTHRVADGQRSKPGEKFLVGGHEMRWPGDTRAPLAEWVNCRCTLAAVPLHDNAAASGHTEPRSTGGPMNDTLVAAAPVEVMYWHGPLAPEGVWSGDRRRFNDGSLTHRDLPLPLTHQVAQAPGHDGAVTVASIDWLQKRGNVMHGGGRMLQTQEADDLVGLMAHFGRMGVSIDGDRAEGGFANEDGTPFDLAQFDDGEEPYGEAYDAIRICSAAACNIPAFAEAWITLGPDPDYQPEEPSLAAAAVGGISALTFNDPPLNGNRIMLTSASSSSPDGLVTVDVATSAVEAVDAAAAVFAISDKPWDGSTSRFTPEQWKRSCILHLDDSLDKASHKLPIKEPDGDLSRAGVHAAAGRINQVDAPDDKVAAAKRALRSAYSTLGEEPPESLALVDDGDDSTVAASGTTEGFRRGPGWVTNPADTKRIHDYWTVPGHEGYEKIAWGTPGDFERCRVQIGAKIAENSPEDVRFLNQICAQWHHDATGFWPGHAPAEAGSLNQPDGAPAPAVTLVASATTIAPAAWFADPKLTEPTPLTITEDGHIFGHLADWNTCHMNYAQPGQCINPPRSASGYAYFRHGEVLTDEGPVATGPITLTTGHAPDRLRMRPAIAHYDNTGTAVADVACYDDDFGIAINGWVRPWVSEEKVYELRAASLSGDWRRDPNTGEMEMIAALAVNAPGFPVRRFGYDDGVQVSLVASLGTVETTVDDDSGLDELAEKIAAHIEDRETRRKAVDDLAEVFD